MIRDLVYYGHPALRTKCTEITEITEDMRQLAQDLIETALEKDGAGLAAPQIGYTVRMFVSRYDNGADAEGWPILCPPKIYINPKLSNPSKEMDTHGEGCLSIPGLYEKVTRPLEIDVEWMDLDGNIQTERATGWRARNLMHENDHLNGVLHIDRIHPNRRKKIDPALRKLKKKYNP
ncbi:peptide deformylase [Candidatus Neptunochlamydia vexilliferae]|uniref:Peptide deformylase n=1 Tax=Candidatus Neptunichlamydia vexilliferae TaxID=1651774 RepID=A0ABS0AYP2_9BACT|nr:peptide deformylase [Candidatus Neptunochlamydia vexilliferae]MBF5059243.1 Peptide deformylase [Candidatus Neptunochlamydia vexilliferae]